MKNPIKSMKLREKVYLDIMFKDNKHIFKLNNLVKILIIPNLKLFFSFKKQNIFNKKASSSLQN